MDVNRLEFRGVFSRCEICQENCPGGWQYSERSVKPLIVTETREKNLFQQGLLPMANSTEEFAFHTREYGRWRRTGENHRGALRLTRNRHMLTREENELLTRTGPGTPMGRYIRRFWVPALFSRQLPEADCPPVRVKLLSEKLVAFRDSNGTVGLVNER